MKRMNMYKKYNLQFFAEKKKDKEGEEDKDSEDEEGDDDDQDDESEQSEKKKKAKTFTQEELDEAIERRLKRERKKAKAKEKNEEHSEKKSDSDDKVQALEAKIICLERGIKKESVSDVVTLAKSYVDDETDLEEAIEMVIEKYPHFTKSDDKKDDKDDKGSKGVKGKDPNNKTKKSQDQTKNPWSKEHFNLTLQAKMLSEDPELAAQYMAAQ